jgi:DNA-binding response OmpR family regulator
MSCILIIEDDAALGGFLLDHLSRSGFDVRMATSGEEGLAMAMKVPADLLILDVMLPGATGYQVCGKLRQAERTRAIPVLMMTGVASHPNQQAIGKIMGANEYLLKPFSVMDLDGRVDKLLGIEDSFQLSTLAKSL